MFEDEHHLRPETDKMSCVIVLLFDGMDHAKNKMTKNV